MCSNTNINLTIYGETHEKILWAILLSGLSAHSMASLSPTCVRYFAETDVYFSELPAEQAAMLKKNNIKLIKNNFLIYLRVSKKKLVNML